MKKLLCLNIILLNLLLCTACGYGKTANADSKESKTAASTEAAVSKTDLQEAFQKWDTSSIDESEKKSIVEKFTGYLKTSDIQPESLNELSQRFIVKNLNDIYAVTYLEAPELYGESGKLSYTWLLYKGMVKLVFHEDSKEIEDIIQDNNDNNIFYLIGRDYLVTSCTGVFVSRIELAGEAIEFQSNAIELDANDSFSLQDGVLYGKSHLVIQKENTDSSPIHVQELNGDSSLDLHSTNDHVFKG